MSRSGYSDDLDPWNLIRWRGQVASAIRGKRGQRLLVDLVKAMDAMPEKRLIRDELIIETGDVCALGAVGVGRGVLMWDMKPDDPQSVAAAFDVADCLAQEVTYVNDEAGPWKGETPEERFQRVRAWALANIRPVETGEPIPDEPA